MARNLSLITVPVDEVIDGVNVIYAGTLDDALFGPSSFNAGSFSPASFRLSMT